MSSPEQNQGGEWERMRHAELVSVELTRNRVEGVSYHFEDGAELLTLYLLRERAALLEQRGKHLKFADRYAPESPLSELSKTMTRHWISRTNTFESKLKVGDDRAHSSAKSLAELDGKYDFGVDIAQVREGVDLGVDNKKAERTQSLLVDFTKTFKAVRSPNTWLRLQEIDRGGVYAAKLAGFAIHGSGAETVVEPMVFDDAHNRVLLPETVYALPTINVRI
jgi:hypothetical protein